MGILMYIFGCMCDMSLMSNSILMYIFGCMCDMSLMSNSILNVHIWMRV